MRERRTAWIIGGGTGIGFATAARFAQRGVAVALSGRRSAVLEKAKTRLESEVPEADVVIVPGDCGVEAEAHQIARAVLERLDQIDVCVNGAGVYEPVGFLDMDEASWRRTLISSLDSMVYPLVPIARAMKAAGHGRFVLISSTNSSSSEPESAHYSAAKAGVASLARSMAIDLGQHGIQVNAVAPGWVHTAMVDDFVQNVTAETLKRMNVLGRVGQPDELANVIEYLGLDAPDYLTGETIFVDGGQTAMAPLM